MIPLNEQITSLFFSFAYGILISLIVLLNYKLLFVSKYPLRIIGTFFLILNVLLIYYLGLRNINDGIIHPYFIVALLLGYCLGNVNYKKIYENTSKTEIK